MDVAWMHFEQSAILTVHNHVITRNPRISVTHDKHDRHRTWYLHINNVQEEDKGRYMCQINTVTAKTQFGYLNVVAYSNLLMCYVQLVRGILIIVHEPSANLVDSETRAIQHPSRTPKHN
uniref:Ig domain-containing protein n=1 Tax=Glossina pallidipes TaxID=7398 RepID=A0A1B0A4Z5_GLOPL